MRRALGSVAFVTLVFAALQCEAIVSSDVPQFNCSGTAKNVCPPGKYCKGSGCVPCETTDVCDHYDNDCNGIVDDGLADQDNDTYTVCGDYDVANDNKIINIDCNDRAAGIHPNDPVRHPVDRAGNPLALAVQRCNGADDDCSGAADDGKYCNDPATCMCPESTVCKSALHNPNPIDNCSPLTSDCNSNPALCKGQETCDVPTGKCTSNIVGAIGSACVGDRQCPVGAFCGSSAYLGPITATNVCTKTCCASSDCPTDFVCYAPGTAGRYCVSKASLQIAAVGSLPAGASTNDPTQCRSGQIEAGRCIDVCCTSANCTNGTACHETTLRGKSALACIPGNTTGSGKCCGGSICGGSPSACGEGVCERIDNFADLCMAPCCGSAGCPGRSTFYGDFVCRAYGTNNGVFTSCAVSGVSRGSAQSGTDCNTDGDCASLYCDVPTSTHTHKYCTDYCCTDADCGNGTRCRPVSESNAYILHCIYP